MKKLVWLLVVVLGLVVVTDVFARENTAFRKYINENLSIGLDRGKVISFWDIKKSELKGGYSFPGIQYEFPDSNPILGPYDISLDAGFVGDEEDVDPILGPGSNAPKVAIQWIIDHSVNKVLSKDVVIPEVAKIGLVLRGDAQRLINEGELAGSYGVEGGFGFKFD